MGASLLVFILECISDCGEGTSVVELDCFVVALVENAMVEGEGEVVVIAKLKVPRNTRPEVETLKSGEYFAIVESIERDTSRRKTLISIE